MDVPCINETENYNIKQTSNSVCSDSLGEVDQGGTDLMQEGGWDKG